MIFSKNEMKCQVFPVTRKQSCIITCIKNWLGTNLLVEATVMKKFFYNIDVMIILKSDEIVTLKYQLKNRVVQNGATFQVTKTQSYKASFIYQR